VQLQLDLLCRKTIIREKDRRSALERLPQTLEESYNQIYHQMSELETPTRLVAERALAWLFCGKRQLSTQELIAAGSIDSTGASEEVSEGNVLDIYFSLVVLDDVSRR
jgi:hypothetical protein